MSKYPCALIKDLLNKLTKKLKVWGLITAVIGIIAIAAIGTIEYNRGEETKNDLLTLKTIVKTFEKQGVILKDDRFKSPMDFELNGVKPAVFNIGDKKDTLLVYTFKSFIEREDIVREASKFNNSYSLLESLFNAKNTFYVYIVSQNPMTEEDMRSVSETKALISNIVLNDLNDGKEIVYKGQSASWEGTFSLKYYVHWWQDETGTLRHESYHNEYPTIKYKMPDIEAVGPINFEYKTTNSSGSSTGVELNKDGYPLLGSSGGNGAMHS